SPTRDPAENLASYTINQGSLTSDSNYTISFSSNSLSITPAALVINADPQTKVFGPTDPSLTYTIVSGLQAIDPTAGLSGSLTRDPGENVASYAINQGSLTSDSNYTISFSGNSLSITPAALVINADPQTKGFGQTDPSLTYTIVSGLQAI